MNKRGWIFWLVLTSMLLGFLLLQLTGKDKSLYLPGPTTHGHYQIEMKCDSCHGEAFTSADVIQDACMGCHGDELKAAKDAHPRAKFTNPRNANRVKVLDARICVTCHVEHQPKMTNAMGVTVPDDVCAYCHEDIASDRPSHTGMAFNTCASAGCHNYHDNRGLYEDFLIKHLDEPVIKETPRLMSRNLKNSLKLEAAYPHQSYPISTLGRFDVDAPAAALESQTLVLEWERSSHAKAGVNCSACHKTGQMQTWRDQPSYQQCQGCHELETVGFLSGRHGMRLKQNLSPMKPELARLAMKVTDKELDCNACHSGHDFNTREAAVNSCLTCHDDQHSRNYKLSSHYSLWQQELKGEIAPASGVACSTCHMPRTPIKQGEHRRVLVQHNQNDNLRPNEKMLRSVCMNCHGLGFSIDALADPVLVQNNFNGKPALHIESLDMAKQRIGNVQPARVGEGSE